MHVRTNRLKDGRTAMAFCENYRDGRKTRTRTVERIGCVEDFPELDDPVAHFKQVARERTAAAREESTVTVELHMAQKVDKRAEGERRCAGAAVACAAYNALGVERALRNSSRGSGAEYDLNAAMRLFVAERLVDPGSKLSAWENRHRHFFRSELSERDCYRALDGIAAARPAVLGAVNRAVAAMGGRDASCLYYDVTNYHFEVEGDGDGLRRRGCAKNHMPKPIVQMGLVQDAEGIPVGYRLFPGNTVDCETMLPVYGDVRAMAGGGRVVSVADKGNNTSTNMALLVAAGDGFVFSQSIRGTKSKASLREWATSEEGYRVTASDKESGEPLFKVKSRQDSKTVHLKAEDTADGRPADVPVEVKVVAFWSRKYERKARAERAKVLEKARRLVESPGAYSAATHKGAARWVKDVSFDRESGEVVTGKSSEIDWEAVAEAEKCDGYYVIVTSETGWDEDRIIDAYRELWRIEESFKVTKSELRARPVYVWTPEHIEAHFLICFVALTVTRLLQRALGYRWSCEEILDDMAATCMTKLVSNIWVSDHRTDLTDELFALMGSPAPLKQMRLKDVKALFAKSVEIDLRRKSPRKKKSAKKR